MSGIFPKAADGAVAAVDTVGAKAPGINPTADGALFFPASCGIRLRPEVLNSMISEISEVVDNLGQFPYDPTKQDNMHRAINFAIRRYGVQYFVQPANPLFGDVPVSGVPCVTLNPMDWWFNTTNNKLYYHFYDGTGYAWVEAGGGGGGGGGGWTPPAGGPGFLYKDGSGNYSWQAGAGGGGGLLFSGAFDLNHGGMNFNWKEVSDPALDIQLIGSFMIPQTQPYFVRVRFDSKAVPQRKYVVYCSRNNTPFSIQAQTDQYFDFTDPGDSYIGRFAVFGI